MGKAKAITISRKAEIESRKASQVKTRKILPSDAEAIAELTAQGLNESESCAMLGIKRESWFNWKSINASQYDDIFTRIRGNRIKSLISEVQAAAHGDADRGIRHDWRAADRLLAISAPERFAKQPETTQQPTVNVLVTSELSRLVYGDAIDAQVVSDATERKQIAAGG